MISISLFCFFFPMALKSKTKTEKKFIKNARNVLSIPNELLWPSLDEEGNAEFADIFQESMKHAKTISLKLPLFKAKKLTKEERRRQIQELYSKLSPESLSTHQKAMHLRKSLALGVNDVCRSLEKEELACCLICGEAKPKLLVTHLIDLAKTKRTPLLILNSLKKLMIQSIGFSSLAVGFKKEITMDPNHAMNFLCTEVLRLFTEKYSYDSESSKINEEDITRSIELITHKKKMLNDEKELAVNLTELNEIYLYRESTTYRVFKPNEQNLPETNSMELDIDDSSSEETRTVINKKARFYEPPTIRRIQMNPNKIRKLKKKRNKL